MNLEGTISTPFGAVKKKTAVIVGGIALLVIGIGWYRSRGQSSAAPVSEEDINPATGFVYGSQEDLNALAAQSSGGSSGGGGGGGSAAMPDVTIGYASNSQWSQATIEYFTEHSLVTDPSLISEAIGKYLSGAYLRADETSLVEQAIAVSGYPPVAGTKGFPPSINTTPPSTPAPTPTPIPTPTPTPTIPSTLPAPMNTNLYNWCGYVAGTYHISYDLNIMRSLNPGIDKWITWIPRPGNPTGNEPQFQKSGTPAIRIK